jgi:hypothetical protein
VVHTRHWGHGLPRTPSPPCSRRRRSAAVADSPSSSWRSCSSPLRPCRSSPIGGGRIGPRRRRVVWRRCLALRAASTGRRSQTGLRAYQGYQAGDWVDRRCINWEGARAALLTPAPITSSRSAARVRIRRRTLRTKSRMTPTCRPPSTRPPTTSERPSKEDLQRAGCLPRHCRSGYWRCSSRTTRRPHDSRLVPRRRGTQHGAVRRERWTFWQRCR